LAERITKAGKPLVLLEIQARSSSRGPEPRPQTRKRI
jgi:hypothetical protein